MITLSLTPDIEPAYMPAASNRFTSLSWDELDSPISGDAKVLLALIRRDNWQRETDSISNANLDLIARARGYVVAELIDELVTAKLLRRLKHGYRDVNAAELGLAPKQREEKRANDAERKRRSRAGHTMSRQVTKTSANVTHKTSIPNTNVTRDQSVTFPIREEKRREETRQEETTREETIRDETETNPWQRPPLMSVHERHQLRMAERLKASSQQEENHA